MEEESLAMDPLHHGNGESLPVWGQIQGGNPIISVLQVAKKCDEGPEKYTGTVMDIGQKNEECYD
jgi:hypothetical protein